MRIPFSRLVIFAACVGVLGLLLLIAANHFGLTVLIGPGLLLFAVGTAAAGLNAVVRRHVYDRNNETTRTQTFVGPAAVFVGLVLVLLALVFAVAGAAFVLGQEDALVDLLLERPSPAFLVGGAVLGGAGAARVFGAREWRGSLMSFLGSLPERFSGVLLLAVGLALVGVGVLELLAPALFDEIFEGLLGAPMRRT